MPIQTNRFNCLENDIPVIAFDFDAREKIGQFDSMSQAAKRLFIKNKGAIYEYIFGGYNSKFTGKKKGVTSYKDCKKYHFELVKR